ncbi:MAG: hypothetical protein IIB57_07000 [Planctomycetes bacterium]|nr:hypothetical protein [Planctomycetota bacterium]
MVTIDKDQVVLHIAAIVAPATEPLVQGVAVRLGDIAHLRQIVTQRLLLVGTLPDAPFSRIFPFDPGNHPLGQGGNLPTNARSSERFVT